MPRPWIQRCECRRQSCQILTGEIYETKKNARKIWEGIADDGGIFEWCILMMMMMMMIFDLIWFPATLTKLMKFMTLGILELRCCEVQVPQAGYRSSKYFGEKGSRMPAEGLDNLLHWCSYVTHSLLTETGCTSISTGRFQVDWISEGLDKVAKKDVQPEVSWSFGVEIWEST